MKMNKQEINSRNRNKKRFKLSLKKTSKKRQMNLMKMTAVNEA